MSEETDAQVETLMNLMEDTVSCLLYYDRKEDEDLPVGAIEKLVKDGEITIDQIVEKFEYHLREALS